MEILLGTVATTAGAVVLFGLTEASRAVTNRRRAVKELKQAALACLDRLGRIRQTKLESEIHHLGPELDRWRDCIAVTPKDRQKHWEAYQSAVPILLDHNLHELSQVIGVIAKLVDVDYEVDGD